MAARIREVAGTAEVTLVPSDRGAFEIRVNGELIHSKLRTHDWPDFDAVAQQIKAKA